MKKNYFMPVALLSLSFLTACNDPLKTTEQMKETTSGMAITTSEMKSNVVNTNDNSAKLGMLMAQGQASDFRDSQFAHMLESKEFMEKMDYAVKFMYSFEFQIFSDEGIATYDTEEMLEQARAEAIKEIPKKLNGVFNKKIRAGVSGIETDSDSANFFAIACALHYKNPKQVEFRRGMGLPTESMLDLIVEALSKKKDLENGIIKVSELRKFEREVLKEEHLFVRMIEVRHRFIPSMAIARISKIEDGFINKLDMVFTKRWRPTFLQPGTAELMNIVELDYIQEMLGHSIIAKKILAEQGRESKLDKTLVKIINHMDLTVNPKKPVILSEVADESVKSMKKSFDDLLALDADAAE
ncbi:MAG: hypothetical protein ACOYL6_18700 [Bacteriovoracaceae bacterium]